MWKKKINHAYAITDYCERIRSACPCAAVDRCQRKRSTLACAAVDRHGRRRGEELTIRDFHFLGFEPFREVREWDFFLSYIYIFRLNSASMAAWAKKLCLLPVL